MWSLSQLTQVSYSYLFAHFAQVAARPARVVNNAYPSRARARHVSATAVALQVSRRVPMLRRIRRRIRHLQLVQPPVHYERRVRLGADRSTISRISVVAQTRI